MPAGGYNTGGVLVLTRKPGEKIVVGNDESVIEIASVERGVVRFALHVREAITLMPGMIEVGLPAGDGVRQTVSVTRKVDDSVVIGADPGHQVEVLVVSVKGEAVRVGVNAPRDMQVHREEIFELNRQQMLAAAEPPARDVDPEAIQKLLGKQGRIKGDGGEGEDGEGGGEA